MKNIPDNFCLQEHHNDIQKYDVCLCYNKRTDLASAGFIEGKLRDAGVERIFVAARPGCNVEIEQAKAVCNSRVILVLISSGTFDGIAGLHQVANTTQPLSEEQVA